MPLVIVRALVCFSTVWLVLDLRAIGGAAEADATAFWPQFHGPRRDNISTEEGLLRQWPEAGPKRLWTARGIGEGFATVSIAGGLIYTTGDIDDKTIITALDMDGRMRWQAANGRAWTASQPGARMTPTLDGERLYHESPHGDLACLEAKTGEKIWGRNVLDVFRGQNISWALSESPLVDGNNVICSPGGPETAMVALDKRTGGTVWKSPGAGDLAGYASPSLGEHQGLRMVFTLTSRALIGVNADTGDLLFRFEHVTPFDETILMPIYHDGHVFISTRTAGSVLLKLHVDGKKASVEQVWRTEELDNQHGGVVLWEGHLYGAAHVNNNGKWMCLDWRTGRPTYAERGIGKGSLTYADGMFYMMSERRDVGLVKAKPDAYELVSQFKLPPGGEGPSWAHPVVCGGRLYIRYSDFLHAYDVRAEP